MRGMKIALTVALVALSCMNLVNAQEDDALVQEAPVDPSLRTILPPVIYAVPGVEMSVYFDNIILHPDSDRFIYDVQCTIGRQQQERWTVVPDAEQVGDHGLTIRILTPEMVPLHEMSTTVRVVDAAAGAGETISALVIGDSLTAASAYPGRVVSLFATEGNPALTMIGETGPGGDSGNRHEGYGGWSCERFACAWDPEAEWKEVSGRMRRTRSPFLFETPDGPVLDFSRYFEKNSAGAPPDFITILLGCNDTFSSDETNIEERIDTMFGHLDTLLAAIRAAAPEAEIGLLTLVPPAASQDAFGANYGCGQNRWQYRRNQHRVVEREMETYGGREAEGIFLLPAHVNIDSVWGFPRTSVALGGHEETKIPRMSNGVHPATAGYYQIGDSIFAWMKARLAAR
jgi:lysophospholipase L1-like esterase